MTEAERERHIRNVRIAREQYEAVARSSGLPLLLDVALTLAKVEKEWKPK
jgi:hypothetical protein